MNNQINFFETPDIDINEFLLNKIKNYLDANGFLYENVTIRKNLRDFSFIVEKQIFFKKLEEKDITYILVKQYYKEFLESNNVKYEPIKSTIWLKIKYDDFISIFDDLLFKIYDSIYYASDFSCCSRYEQCSDAKKCIQPNKPLALQCSYRKKLEKGIIFYGKNLNVKLIEP